MALVGITNTWIILFGRVTLSIKFLFLKDDQESTKSTVSSGTFLKYTFDRYSCSSFGPIFTDFEAMV